jgi:gentisate 1,2-dioxygenase
MAGRQSITGSIIYNMNNPKIIGTIKLCRLKYKWVGDDFEVIPEWETYNVISIDSQRNFVTILTGDKEFLVVDLNNEEKWELNLA